MTATLMTAHRRPARKPPLALTSTDFTRSAWEFGAYASTWPAMASAPVSDGPQPVLVLPGFTTSDLTTTP